MIDPDQALDTVLEHAEILSPVHLPLSQAFGHVLAETVTADRDYPPFDRAMMDGVAVRLSDAGREVEVCEEVAAGAEPKTRVAPGRCVEIMTGAACPEGTEAVVPEEFIEMKGGRVRLPDELPRKRHIVRRGTECTAGSVVLDKGWRITAQAVGVLASVGRKEVKVHPFPRIGVITTGPEVKEQDEEIGTFQIRNSNGPMMEVMARSTGVRTVERFHADDTEASITGALEKVRDMEIILFSGGISKGRYDLVPDRLKHYGAEILFRRVRQKPGKPLLFAGKGRQLIFGLPGNPLAVHFCFHRYVSAAVRKMACFSARAHQEAGILAEAVRVSGIRPAFILATAVREGKSWKVSPCKPASTADLFNVALADCYIHVPAGTTDFELGKTVDLTWLGGTPPPRPRAGTDATSGESSIGQRKV